MKQLVMTIFLLLLGSMLLFSSACGDDDDDDDDNDNDDDASSTPEPDDDDASPVDDDDDDDNDNDDDDNDVSPTDDDDDDDTGSGVSIHFELNEEARDIPFPSLAFTAPDQSSRTGYRVNIADGVTTYLDPMIDTLYFLFGFINQLEGFGVSTPVWFHTDTDPEITLFPDSQDPGAGDAIFCLDVGDPTNPHYGEYRRLDVNYQDELGLIEVWPHYPFPQRAMIVCAVTKQLLTSGGLTYDQPDHLAYLLAAEANEEDPDYALLEPYRQAWAPYLDRLFSITGLTAADIVSLALYPTQDITGDLESIHAQLAQMAQDEPPTLTVPWTRLNHEHANLDSVWEATYETIDWRQDGVFSRDNNGDPLPVGKQEVVVRLMLPKLGLNGHEPPYPVILYGHGVQSSRGEAEDFSYTMAEQGYATLSIDWDYHGYRTRGLEGLPEWLAILKRFLQYINVFEPLKCSANFQQGIADVIWLKHLVRTFDELDLQPYETGGDGIPDLLTTEIDWASFSLGSIHGGILAAMEPDFNTFLFISGAVDLEMIALEGPYGSIIRQIVNLIDNFIDLELEENIMVFFALMRQGLDGGDPLAFASYVKSEPIYQRFEPLNILQIMAAYDDTLGGPACSEMARTIDLALLEPYVYPIEDVEVVTAPYNGPAVFMYDTSVHEIMYNSDCPYYSAVHEQAAVFLRTAFENGTATIINPLER